MAVVKSSFPRPGSCIGVARVLLGLASLTVVEVGFKAVHVCAQRLRSMIVASLHVVAMATDMTSDDVRMMQSFSEGQTG